MDKIFNNFKMVFLNHIRTKTSDALFHEKSAQLYELLFEVFHAIMEKRQDLWLDEPLDCAIASQKTYDVMVGTKDILESMVSKKNSVGMDNLLRGLIDKLDSACWLSQGLLKEEMEDDEE